jgi:hypothetical protein
MKRSSTLIGTGILALPLLAAGVCAGAPARKAPAAPAAKTASPPTAAPADVPPPDFPAFARGTVERGLPLLQRSAAIFTEKRNCTSCHHQLLTAMAVDEARRKGFRVDEKLAAAQVESLRGELSRMAGLLRQARQDAAAEKKIDFLTVDPPISVGYFMVGLKANGIAPNEATADLAYYLGRKQQEDGRWAAIAGRPPQEASDFTGTALAVYGLKQYGAPADAAEANERIDRARRWLTETPAKTAEDRAFRLLGLVWTGADPAAVRKAVTDITAEQHDDGGWGQLAGMPSDAYATGLSLYALHHGGGMKAMEPIYHRGFLYLILNQQPDGSWRVATRSQPAQPYFETGFPHKKDQFISAAASAWASMALLPAAAPAPATSASAAGR